MWVRVRDSVRVRNLVLIRVRDRVMVRIESKS